MKITFLGGVGTVTGSKYLVEDGDTKILIDCGLFQGLKPLRQQNWRSLPVDIESITAVVLTHAHIDHSGYVPLLVKNGYHGPIYCTEPTRDLCHILLPDSGRLQEEDASYANLKGFSKHKPALPLYTEEDARRSCRQLKGIALHERFKIGDAEISFHGAGHILGAAHVLVKGKHRQVFFSGDIGRYNDQLEKEPEPIPSTVNIVMESTYGDREHKEKDPEQRLADVVNQVIDQRGVLLIPAFAVGRMQVLLYCLSRIFERKKAPQIPVYVDSPMATSVTQLYMKYCDWHRLGAERCEEVNNHARFIRTVEESKALHQKDPPMIVLSASGMLTGGRVLHHFRRYAPHPQNVILLAGFQAPGTRGGSLAAGSRSIKMHGEYVPVAAEVLQFDAFSAHADQKDLLRWLGTCPVTPQRVMLTHGEPAATDELRRKISEKFGYRVELPQYRDVIEL